MIKVDIRTKILPSTHRIYMVRPGSGYHLLKPFFENKAVAPDLAFLDIEDGLQPSKKKGIDAQIARARAFAEWVKTEDRRSEDRPSEKIEDYKGESAPARVTMYKNTADDLLHELPEGSLIFIPNPDFTRNAMFGELSSPKAPRLKFNGSAHRESFVYLGRPLLNVKFIPMRKLPPEFYVPMKLRNWIHEFGQRETELLYRQYYGDFEILGRKSVAEIAVAKARVSGTDINIVGALTNMIDQALARAENGDKEQLSILEAVFLPPEPQGPVIHANIGSPGEVLVESVKRRVAPVLKVIVALALAGYVGTDIWNMVDNGTLTLSNSEALAGASSQQLVDTQARTYDFVRTTGKDNLNQIVELIRDFHARTGGTVDANIHRDE